MELHDFIQIGLGAFFSNRRSVYCNKADGEPPNVTIEHV